MAYERTELPRAQIEAQEAVAHRIAARFAAEGRRPLALVDTYGCQQNESDSERIRGYLAEMGCGFTDDEFAADIIVVNTCAVREHAEQRVLGNVGALNHTKKAKPGQIIALCGCMVQQQHMAERVKRSYPIVNLVFGPHELWRFPELLERVFNERKRVFAVDESAGTVTEGVPRRRDGRVKAWLSVMYGCNNFCSYCIVPHVRGRERSRDPEKIVAECRALIEAGYREICLLGQNVNSYGGDLDAGWDFADLLAAVDAIPGDYWLRFMSSQPKDATPKLFETMARCSHVAKCLHLPMQSGNDRVLRAMPRYGLVQQQLSGLRQQYEAEAKRSADDFNRKYEEFLEGRRDFPPSILRKRQVELQELMQRNVAFKEQGLRELAQAEDSLMTPLRQQLDQALDSIGSELGYALIVNTDAHACPYINPLMGEDITAIVIRRLENKK